MIWVKQITPPHKKRTPKCRWFLSQDSCVTIRFLICQQFEHCKYSSNIKISSGINFVKTRMPENETNEICYRKRNKMFLMRVYEAQWKIDVSCYIHLYIISDLYWRKWNQQQRVPKHECTIEIWYENIYWICYFTIL